MIKSIGIASVACLLAAAHVHAAPPKITLGHYYVGAQYGHWNSDRDSISSVTANTYGYHIGVETSLIEKLFLKDKDWRFRAGDILGASNWIAYGSYTAKNQTKPGSYYAGFGLLVGAGGTFAVTSDIDLGFKYVWDGRALFWGNATQNESLGGSTPTLMARWTRFYGEIGTASKDFGSGEKLDFTTFRLRYYYDQDMLGFFQTQMDFAEHPFGGTGGRVDNTTLIALHWGLSY